jgi:alpha-L-fucosidase 2
MSLASATFMSSPLGQRSYQNFGDLNLVFPTVDSMAVTGYRRDLDIDRAVARTQFQHAGVTYTREVFVSHPDQVVVVRIEADRPGALTFSVSPNTAHRNSTFRRTLADGQLSAQGAVNDGALTFEARVLVDAEGGTVVYGDTIATITGANAATLVLAGATSFVNYDDVTGDPVALNDRTIAAVQGKSYAALRDAHIADHRALFRRVAIDLGTSTSDLPTDERITRYGEGADPGLAALLFQYGRYLLIASSRPGGQPANLQGIWNESNSPPWNSKWTVNIITGFSREAVLDVPDFLQDRICFHGSSLLQVRPVCKLPAA